MALKKILLLSTGDKNGAYEAIYRIGKSLENYYDICMVVRHKSKNEKWIISVPYRKKLKKRIISFYKRFMGVYSTKFEFNPKHLFLENETENDSPYTSENILKVLPFQPDYIISGMTDNFINTSVLLDLQVRTGAKIYQTMVDASLLTGGCHIMWDCKGYLENCSNCPGVDNDLFYSYKNFTSKKFNIEKGDFKLLTCPGWSIEKAEESNLYKNRTIKISHSIIDTELFNNKNREFAKKIFDIPQDNKAIFSGSFNLNAEFKGRKQFIEALEILWEQMNPQEREKIIVIIVGNHNSEDDLNRRIKFKKKLINFVTDYRLLSLLYQANDIFVFPSLEDAGPMMVAENLACGTPVVGFKMGLLFDDSLIIDGFNGYRAKFKDTKELAMHIKTVLDLDEDEFRIVSENARESALKLVSYEAFRKSIEPYLN